MTVLPNGNFVMTDPGYDAGPLADVGAVYLYDGATGALISALTGSTAGDRVGYASDYAASVTALTHGNYVVSSPCWDNAAVVDAGAVTWGYRTSGTTGPITAENSVLGIAENGGRSAGVNTPGSSRSVGQALVQPSGTW